MRQDTPVIINWVEQDEEYVAFNPDNPMLRAYATTRQDALTILEQAQEHAKIAFSLGFFGRPDRARLKPATLPNTP